MNARYANLAVKRLYVTPYQRRVLAGCDDFTLYDGHHSCWPVESLDHLMRTKAEDVGKHSFFVQKNHIHMQLVNHAVENALTRVVDMSYSESSTHVPYQGIQALQW